MMNALDWLIENYFPAAPGADTPDEWNDWGVPESQDQELLGRAWRSRSASSAFGGHAAFADLWDAQPAALQRAYPDPSGTRMYDASSADNALASHLAFWTRRDHTRILRMMKTSKLVRDKWDREDYLPRTIIKACASVANVLQPDPPPGIVPASAPVVMIPAIPDSGQAPVTGADTSAGALDTSTGNDTPLAYNGDTFLLPHQQPEHFKGCVYIVSLNRVLTDTGAILGKDQFDVVYGGRSFAMDTSNVKVSKSAWETFTRSQAYKFPRADAPCFRPEHPPRAIVHDAGRTLVNVYVPIVTASQPGDIAPFLNHLRKLFPDKSDRAIIKAYLAALVQFPGDKFQWWPLIQGVQGNGKSLILSVVEHAIGHRYCHRPNAQDLGGNGGKFNAWIQGRVLIGIEEIKVAHKAELLEIMKPIITNDLLEIQGKGADQFTGDNRANGLLFTNHKDAMPQRNDDRRYAIFFTAQQAVEDIARDGMDGEYFPKIYDWLRAGGFAHVTHWLKSYQIPADLNPALQHGGKLNRAPATSSTAEALSVSMGRIEQEILDMIASGEPGFCGGWVSSHMLGRLIKDAGGRGLSRYRQSEMLRSLGYIPHPWLRNGRVDNVVLPDGKKPVLYVKVGHPAASETRPAEVAKMYAKAQPNQFNPTPIEQPTGQVVPFPPAPPTRG